MTFTPVFNRSFSPTFDRRNAGGVWWNLFGAIPNANVVAAYQPKGAADQATSYINLVTPGTYNAAAGTAPTWDATNGWKFDAVSAQYLTTGITPVNDQTWSAIVRYTNVSNAGFLFGGYTVAIFAIRPNSSSKVVYANGDASTGLAISPAVTAGTLAIGGTVAYRNGVAEIGAIPAGAGAIGAVMIGKLTATLFPITGYIQALAIYNATLTGPQNAALYTAINAI